MITVTAGDSAVRCPLVPRRAAKSDRQLTLVKTAVHGGDPNWGRMMAAAGRSGADFQCRWRTMRMGRSCCSRTVCLTTSRPRMVHETSAQRHRSRYPAPEAKRDRWTCDLSAEYVRINGEYRT